MLFQNNIFRGLRRGHTKSNTNVSFHFKRDAANVVSKVKCNVILLILFFVCKLEIFLVCCYG